MCALNLKLTFVIFLLLLHNNLDVKHRGLNSRIPAGAEEQNCSTLLKILAQSADLSDSELANQQFVERAAQLLKEEKYRSIEETLGMNSMGVFSVHNLSFSQIEYSRISSLTSRKISPIENIMKRVEIKSMEELEEGANEVFLVTLENGIQAIWKPHQEVWFSNYRAEILAYELDQLFGFNLVPPTIERTINGQKGSLQLFIKSGDNNTRTTALKSEFDKQELLDFIMDNRDRHSGNGNYFISENNHLVSIDNGLSFTGKGLHGRRFISRMKNVNDFIKTQEGLDIIEKLKKLDYTSFRREIVQYLGENDTDLLIRRMKFIILFSES